MAIWTRRARYAFIVAALLAGCRGGGDEQEGPPVAVDTTNKDWADGLSAQQVEAQARAMTPEQAAAAGVAVDTTIHMENLGNSDSAFVDDDAGADTIPASSPTPTPDTTRAAGGASPNRQP